MSTQPIKPSVTPPPPATGTISGGGAAASDKSKTNPLKAGDPKAATTPATDPTKAGATPAATPAGPKAAPKAVDTGSDARDVSVFRVKIGGSLILDSTRGDILMNPPPHVWLSSRRHSEARFVVNDEDRSVLGFLLANTAQKTPPAPMEVPAATGTITGTSPEAAKAAAITKENESKSKADPKAAPGTKSGTVAKATVPTPTPTKATTPPPKGATTPIKADASKAGAAVIAGANTKATNPGEKANTTPTPDAAAATPPPETPVTPSPGVDVEIEIGFLNGFVRNIFVGKIYRVGAIPPSGTIVHCVDTAIALQQTTAPTTAPAGETPLGQEKVVDASKAGDTTKAGKAGDTTKAGTTPTTKSSGTVANNPNQKGIKVPDKVPAKSAQAPKAAPLPNGSAIAPPKLPTANGTVGNTPAAASKQQGSKEGTLESIVDVVGLINSTKVITTPAEHFTLASGGNNLKFVRGTQFNALKQGSAAFQQTLMSAATTDAALRGDIVVVRANTITEASADTSNSTGVILDYKGNPSVFATHPVVSRSTGLQLQSALGSLTVQGWNPGNKEAVSATAVNPADGPTPPPGATIQVADSFAKIKLNEPIFPGCLYTWADATKNGTRVPRTKAIMQGIANIAQAIMPLTEKTVGKGKKWTITSWYRDPVSNRAVGGVPNSNHLQGHAVDANFPSYKQFHRELAATWHGGVASGDGFVHIDLGARRRWTY